MKDIIEEFKKEEFMKLFKKLKKKPCYFCKEDKNIIVTIVKVWEKIDKEKQLEKIVPICHVCFNQGSNLDGLEYKGRVVRINPN